jgi:sugar transferase EpsL
MVELGIYRHCGKRLFDLVTSILLAIVLSPILVVAALLVRIFLGSSVLFVQERPGLDGKIFHLVKFRTMSTEKDKDDKDLPDRSRLTRFGTFLRSSSLDELPELWNVIRGEMSLVGPRPLLTEYLPRYSEAQARRHEVLPGITGWAQINGRNNLDWDARFKADLWYVDNLNLMLDLKILLVTVWKALRRSDINQDGTATMERFQGTKSANFRK